MQFALESVDGVVWADVNPDKGLATVNVKKGEVQVLQLIAAVEEMGFKAFLPQPQAVEASGKSGATWGNVKVAKF